MKSETENTQEKPHWTETLPNGERVFCVKERRHGEKLIHRYTFQELAEILNRAVDEKAENNPG